MCPKILKLKNASAKCKAACTAIEARVERRRVQIVTKHVGQRLAIRRRQQRGLLPQTAADILVDVPLPTLRRKPGGPPRPRMPVPISCQRPAHHNVRRVKQASALNRVPGYSRALGHGGHLSCEVGVLSGFDIQSPIQPSTLRTPAPPGPPTPTLRAPTHTLSWRYRRRAR